MRTHTEPASPKIILRRVLETDLETREIQLCLATVSSEGVPDVQCVQISRDAMAQFRSVAAAVLAKYHEQLVNGDLLVQGFDTCAKLDSHEVEYLDLSKSDYVSAQISSLKELAHVETFRGDKDFVDGLRFYAIVARAKEAPQLLFIRSYSAKKTLRQSGLFALFAKQGTYNKLDDSALLFDDRIDCVAMGDGLFILDKVKFQQVFRFYEMVRSAGLVTLKAIEGRIPIHNYAEFALSCESHLLKLAKLRNIGQRPYFRQVTMADLKRVISRFGLPIKTVGQGEDEQLLFDATNRWAILKLLDDDYLGSEMTGSQYEVNSKRSLGSGT